MNRSGLYDIKEQTSMSDFLTEATAGGAIQHLQYKMFGSGALHRYTQHSSLLGGGWKNRFVMSTRGGLLDILGSEATYNVNKLQKGLRASGLQVPKNLDFSLFGWRNVQNEAIAAGKPIPTNIFSAMKMSKSVVIGNVVQAAVGIFTVGSGIYQGYKEGGKLGALKGGLKAAGQYAAYSVAETALASLTGVSLSAVLAPIGAVYGGYKALEMGQEHYRGMKQTEFSSQSMYDPYGVGATMRQRSLMAIQRSSINGRLALGNEARLLHTRLR